ncbi:MAG: hypothetical protein GVY13_18895 [Alphaproteobacteria bacterium]|nr:hypothetical protein [Alphaproteobacteria bacterium]
MEQQLTQQDLEAACRALIRARHSNLGVEITLPVLYPDGQAVDVAVTVDAGTYVVHDASNGSFYLSKHGVEFTARLRDRLAALAESYGCDFLSGRVSMACTADVIAVAIALVANASRAIGDEARRVALGRARLFEKAVTGRLKTLCAERLQERAEVIGDSGRVYRVGHVITAADCRSPLCFIETVANEKAVPRRVAEFLDLTDEYPEVPRQSVYDEDLQWESHNLLLLQKVSETIPFSERNPGFLDRTMERLLALAA